MKIILLALIKAYWLIIPEYKRRKCLFKKSCSNYVYDEIENQGLISGLRALKFRITNCTSRYNIIEINEEKILVTKANKTFKEYEINSAILTKKIIKRYGK